MTLRDSPTTWPGQSAALGTGGDEWDQPSSGDVHGGAGQQCRTVNVAIID